MYIYLLSFPLAHARLDLAEDLAHVQDAVNHDAVGGPLDLEVAEKGVCAEQGEDLVERVIRLVRRVDGQLGDIGGQRGELDGWPTGAGAQGQQGEVACSGVVSGVYGGEERRCGGEEVPISCWLGSSRKTEW
jgi:hypothetical protein